MSDTPYIEVLEQRFEQDALARVHAHRLDADVRLGDAARDESLDQLTHLARLLR